MIIVIALIRVKEGKAPEFTKIFKDYASNVRKERGCIEYFPAVDVKTQLPPQSLDENVVTIIEKWESLEALQDHFASPGMREQQKREKGMVEGATIKILQEA